MSGLARILKHLGLSVSGSDNKETPVTQSLRRCGIPVHIGQKTVGFGDADLIIYSTAIGKDHLEQMFRRAGSPGIAFPGTVSMGPRECDPWASFFHAITSCIACASCTPVSL